MRRPAHHAPASATAWEHPYRGLAGLAVFYNDGGDPPAPAPAPKPGPPPQPAATFTQEDLDRIAAKEKSQGARAGARQALEDFAAEHGFKNVEDAKEFIAAARKAQEDALSEQEKREKALADREAQLEQREKAATARERDANRRAVLVGLGATGDDLEDAVALLRVDDTADDQAVNEAAAKLKERRPELFGQPRPADPPTGQMPPAPGGAPAGGPPARQSPSAKPGDRGREMARMRGHNRNAA
ncbi:hypothetical protein [Streptomyces bluensis]|uniref:Uncharacterized protein n=1 Tax=Streptomyces bluensis TaxID=33897 RepID=A0ABW6UU54_9ACTN